MLIPPQYKSLEGEQGNARVGFTQILFNNWGTGISGVCPWYMKLDRQTQIPPAQTQEVVKGKVTFLLNFGDWLKATFRRHPISPEPYTVHPGHPTLAFQIPAARQPAMSRQYMCFTQNLRPEPQTSFLEHAHCLPPYLRRTTWTWKTYP